MLKRDGKIYETLIREKKNGKEKDDRSGDAGGKKKEWKYKQTMGFLEPFIDIGGYATVKFFENSEGDDSRINVISTLKHYFMSILALLQT